jgi:hypothetical protein
LGIATIMGNPQSIPYFSQRYCQNSFRSSSTCITCFTLFAEVSRSVFSSPFNWISITFSTPFLPSFTGTPR